LSVVGSSDDWIELLEGMVPDILRLVVDTWNGLPKPFSDHREDPITRVLCVALRRNRKARDLPFLIDFQNVELDPATAEELGHLDIAFKPTGLPGAPDESIYFCLECKRLNVVVNGVKRPGGSEYVVHGMARFVSGQYATAVRQGGMLGYVLDGNVPSAIANVETNVKAQYVSLAMTAPAMLHPSSVAGLDTARESQHMRKGESTRFRIHHLFVAA